MRQQSILVLVAIASVAVLGLCEFASADFSFTNVADTTGVFNELSRVKGVNDSGTVAFRASFSGGSTYYVGSGGPLTAIAGVGEVGPINNDGTVVFQGPGTLRTGKGGPLTTIVDTGITVGYEDGYHSPSGPSINSNGAVAFRASHSTIGTDAAIFTGSGGPVTKVADICGEFSRLSIPSLNNVGTVAFWADYDNGESAIVTASGGTFSTVIDSMGEFRSFTDVSINDSGTVAFIGFSDTFQSGLYTAKDGMITTIADGTGGLSSPYHPHINNDGMVVFKANIDIGGVDPVNGIFAATNGTIDTVIAVGDPLFGATVTDLWFYHSLNNLGQIAFNYYLDSGIQGIAVATDNGLANPQIVPLPSAALLGTIGLLYSGMRLRRQHA